MDHLGSCRGRSWARVTTDGRSGVGFEGRALGSSGGRIDVNWGRAHVNNRRRVCLALFPLWILEIVDQVTATAHSSPKLFEVNICAHNFYKQKHKVRNGKDRKKHVYGARYT